MCIYYRNEYNKPVWGPCGLNRCAEPTVGHLVCDRGPEPNQPAERLPICREHWLARRDNLSAPYRFEALR